MTAFEPGKEDIAFQVTGRNNGMVHLGVFRMERDADGAVVAGEKIIGFTLYGESARAVAFKLTTESFAAEDMQRASEEWRNRQIEDEQ